MFSFFKKEEAKVKVEDKVWLSEEAKWNACAKMAEANQDVVFVCWFRKTKEALMDFMLTRAVDGTIVQADMLSDAPPGKLLLFVEHYPLPRVEQELFMKVGLSEANVLCSLDEPLFEQFGGDRMMLLMKRMGMERDEIVGHSMVTKAINRAQKKLAAKIKVEKKADSQKEWFQLNFA